MTTSFLEQLARPRPDPGGGAAAAYGGQVAVALLTKVLDLEGRRPGQTPDFQQAWEDWLASARHLAARFRQLRVEDVEAYRRFAQARAAGEGLEAAVRFAIQCPLDIMAAAREALELTDLAGSRCQGHLLADLLVAAELLGAVLRGAYHIAQANLPWVMEPETRKEQAPDLIFVLHQGELTMARVSQSLRERAGPQEDLP
jgi:formiminotetrahydrofolate cyclodeaminase